MKRNTSEIDKEIGKRIRIYRSHRGVSQAKLGEILGVSFQQIQKYESASNRVSASSLLNIANALDYPIANFYDLSISTEVLSDTFPAQNNMHTEWINTIEKMPNQVQKNMLTLCKTIGDTKH